MEFKEAMRTLKRICVARDDCEKCELESNCPFDTVPSDLDFDKAEAILAKWAAEHPERTIADDFFEKFPNAPRNRMDFPYPCAKDCGFPKPPYCDNKAGICYECWRRPLEEE
jgi:hypothetical protein